MLCSGWNVVVQSAGNCVAIVFVLVDGFGNKRCSFSWSFFEFTFLHSASSLGCPQCAQHVKDALIPLAEEREELLIHQGTW